jgi:hypothetical protein
VIRNFVQILMVVAIANPLCCCSADWLISEVTASTPVVSSCCGGGAASTEDAPAKQEHDSENCPHQATKDYKLVTQQELKAGQAVVNYAPVFFVLLDLEIVYPSVRIISKIGETKLSVAEPPSLSQVYCVYRI